MYEVGPPEYLDTKLGEDRPKTVKGVVVRNTWKILAPVDLGSQAEARVQHALNLAEATQGDLTLLYVIDEDSKRAQPVEWPVNAMMPRCGYNVRRLVLTGRVRETVAEYAETLDADLIAVTTRWGPWWSRLRRKPLVRNTAKPVERAVCLTRLSDPIPTAEFKSIVCVVNLDGAENGLIEFSREMAQRSGATLIYLHVLPEMSEGALAYGVAGSDRPLGKEVAEDRLRELTARLSVPYLTAIRTGSAYASIAKLAREHKADLVIIGRSEASLSALDPDAVLSRAPCPVMSVPVQTTRPVTGHNVVHSKTAEERVLALTK